VWLQFVILLAFLQIFFSIYTIGTQNIIVHTIGKTKVFWMVEKTFGIDVLQPCAGSQESDSKVSFLTMPNMSANKTVKHPCLYFL
jgi:hypothetical protein